VIVTFWSDESCGSAVPDDAEEADEEGAPDPEALGAPVELADVELDELDEQAAMARAGTTASAMPANRQDLFIHALLME
jgi:hypothetical protein